MHSKFILCLSLGAALPAAFAAEDAWRRLKLPSRNPQVLGRLKAVAAVDEALARIAERDPELNAFSVVLADAARAEAAATDKVRKADRFRQMVAARLAAGDQGPR